MLNAEFITHRSSLVLFCLITSDGTLKITDFGLVKVGRPEEAVTEQQVLMSVRLSIWDRAWLTSPPAPEKVVVVPTNPHNGDSQECLHGRLYPPLM
jgi:hypothetical protein